MRLLDVHSVINDRLPIFRELLEGDPSSRLPYAILSHTWGKSEHDKDIVFDDIPSQEAYSRFLDETTRMKHWQAIKNKKKAGFSKMINACLVASELELDYIWIDSCCIDKSKSAELNESINSMYRWYENSERCIVHLEDLDPQGQLGNCRWFERGWTLQELVAPSRGVYFFNRNWDFFGERSDTGLCESLSKITGIDMDCLQGQVDLASLSIAHKMSWACGRKTTVPEDRAYSLLGIFDVNMPLIYGEGGTKAFRRLQEEIIRVSSDLSIFAWDPSLGNNAALNAFASKPDEFATYQDMVPSYQSHHFTSTNKGIKMETILWRVRCEDEEERLMLAIGKQKNGKLDLGIILRKLGHNMYVRHGNMRPFSDRDVTSSTRRSTFYLVSPHISAGYDHVLNASRQRAILIPRDGLGNFYIDRPAPEYAWDCEDRLFFNNRHWGGGDWRAVELINKRPAGEFDQRFIALFSLKDPCAMPDCYLLRWRQELAVMFDRRHQTETTRLDEFRYAVEGATTEVDMNSTGAKLSIRLIPTIPSQSSGVQFRMNLKETHLCEPDFLAYMNGLNWPSQIPAFNAVFSLAGSESQRGQESTAAEGSTKHRKIFEQSASSVPSKDNGLIQDMDDRFGSSTGPPSAPDMPSHFGNTLQNSASPIHPQFLFGTQFDGQFTNLAKGENLPLPFSNQLGYRPTGSSEMVSPPYQLHYAFPMAMQHPQIVFTQFQGTGLATAESGSSNPYAAMNDCSNPVM